MKRNLLLFIVSITACEISVPTDKMTLSVAELKAYIAGGGVAWKHTRTQRQANWGAAARQQVCHIRLSTTGSAEDKDDSDLSL